MRVQITEAMTALTDPTTGQPYVLGEWPAVAPDEAMRLQDAERLRPKPSQPPAPSV